MSVELLSNLIFSSAMFIIGLYALWQNYIQSRDRGKRFKYMLSAWVADVLHSKTSRYRDASCPIDLVHIGPGKSNEMLRVGYGSSHVCMGRFCLGFDR